MKRRLSLILIEVFAMTKSRQIMSDDNCLDGTGPGMPVRIVKCHGLRGNQVRGREGAAMMNVRH